MGTKRTAVAVSPVILFVSLFVGSAHADGVAEAEDLFRRGKELMNAGKPAEACSLFKESQRLDPQTGTLLNLALCHEAIGSVGAAWGEFNVVEQQSLATRPPREDRVALAREHAAKLGPRLARLKLVTPQPLAQGEVVKVDGEVRGTPSWSVGIIVEVGTRDIEVSAPGKKPKTLKVGIPQEGTTTTVTLPPLEDAEGGAATESPDAANQARRTTGLLVGGVGLALVAAGGAFGIATIVNNDDARGCPAPCYVDKRPGQESDLATNRALLFANIANVLVPLGAIGAAIGGWLVLTANRATIAPVASRDGAGLGVRGKW